MIIFLLFAKDILFLYAYISDTIIPSNASIDSYGAITLGKSDSPLGATISFEKPEPIEKFDCIYINVNQFGNDSSKEVGEEKGVSLVMRDGTKIYLYQEDGAKEEAFLNADSPIALKEADYLLLSDGTKLDVLSPQQ